MNKQTEHILHVAILTLLLLLGLLYILLSFPSKSLLAYSNRHAAYNAVNATSNYDSQYALKTVLSEASMPNKTVIITIINKAYVGGDFKSMFDMFLDGLWIGEGTRGLVKHLLLVATDKESFERCKFLRLHCYKLEMDSDGVDGDEKLYMSEGFIRMMWRRTLFLGDVLKLGYNFIFTDTDILWLRNPLNRLNWNQAIDLFISTDNFNGDEDSLSNPINTGFYMIKSNNKTIALFDAWYTERTNSIGLKEQDVLNNMIKNKVLQRLDIGVKFLDTMYFSGFCEDSKDIRYVTTVHANCCRTISAKIMDLMEVVRVWKRFMRYSGNDTTAFGRVEHVACINSWKS